MIIGTCTSRSRAARSSSSTPRALRSIIICQIMTQYITLLQHYMCIHTYIYIYIYIHICICILSRNIILHHIISYHIVGADERRVRGAEPVHPGASLKRELEYVVIACSVLCVYMFVVVLSSQLFISMPRPSILRGNWSTGFLDYIIP